MSAIKLRANGQPFLADERFHPMALSCGPTDTLKAMRRALMQEKQSVLHSRETHQLHRKLDRQLAWLDIRLRERAFFRKLREQRGAPESKEERTILFERAFFRAARARLEPADMKELCAEAEAIVDDGTKP